MKVSQVLLAVAFLVVPAVRGQSGLDAGQLYKTDNANGISISFLLNRDGQEYRVPTDSVFRTGDKIKITVSTNFTGFVYVFNVSPTGETTILFPTAQAGAYNQVRKGEKYVIPTSDGGWFKFVGPAGEERVYVILSRERLPDMEADFSRSSFSAKREPGATQEPPKAPLTVATVQPASQSVAAPPVLLSEVSPPPAAPPARPAVQPGPVAAVPEPTKQETIAAQPSVQVETAGKRSETASTIESATEKAADAVKAPAKVSQTVNKTVAEAAKAPKKAAKAPTKVMRQAKSGVKTLSSVTGMPVSVANSVKRLRFRDLVFTNDSLEKTAYVTLPGRLDDTVPVIFELTLIHE